MCTPSYIKEKWINSLLFITCFYCRWQKNNHRCFKLWIRRCNSWWNDYRQPRQLMGRSYVRRHCKYLKAYLIYDWYLLVCTDIFLFLLNKSGIHLVITKCMPLLVHVKVSTHQRRCQLSGCALWVVVEYCAISFAVGRDCRVYEAAVRVLYTTNVTYWLNLPNKAVRAGV